MPLYLKVVVFLLSEVSLSRSATAYTHEFENLSERASIVPFSQIILSPANTRSVVDSPHPASAYMYTE